MVREPEIPDFTATFVPKQDNRGPTRREVVSLVSAEEVIKSSPQLGYRDYL